MKTKNIIAVLFVVSLFTQRFADAADTGISQAPKEKDSTAIKTIERAEELNTNGDFWYARSILKPLLNKEFDETVQARFNLSWQKAQSWWYKFWVSRIAFGISVFFISFGMYLSMRGRKFPIRKIPGLEAMKEAVGRATEMGRPSLFCIGVSNMDHPETFASMPILRHIAKVGAKLRNRLIIPICSERTITLQQMAYREACQSVGELRSYNPGDIRFFPGGQFYFAVTAMSYMLKERPAACFYFGYWEAESLMLSETGNAIGAMQIAGTSQLYQVPFFIAACDYVIIGEEFFAVSAKLSEEPILSGSLFGQDVVKILILMAVIIGTIAISIAAWAPAIRRLIDMLAH